MVTPDINLVVLAIFKMADTSANSFPLFTPRISRESSRRTVLRLPASGLGKF